MGDLRGVEHKGGWVWSLILVLLGVFFFIDLFICFLFFFLVYMATSSRYLTVGEGKDTSIQ